jgi:hypothetical protein
MREQESAQAAAVADVGAVRIPLAVGVGVMRAVVGNPVEHRTLDRERPEHRERPLEPRVGGERPVGEQPVEADRPPRGGEQVHAGEDREVGEVHRPVPEQDDGGEHAGEGHEHPEQVGEAFRSGHPVRIS